MPEQRRADQAIALEIAPLVRLGVLTDAEGRSLVDLRYLVDLSRV